MRTTLGDRIKIARERAGLRQDQLGAALGVHRNTVSAWEQDERVPDGESLLKLPGLLRMSADALLLGSTTVDGFMLPSREALVELRHWIDHVLPPGD